MRCAPCETQAAVRSAEERGTRSPGGRRDSSSKDRDGRGRRGEAGTRFRWTFQHVHASHRKAGRGAGGRSADSCTGSFSHLASRPSCSIESGSRHASNGRPILFRTPASRTEDSDRRRRSPRSSTEMRASLPLVLLTCALLAPSLQRPQDSLPATILGGIGNVASTATDFLTRTMQRQTELLQRVTDAAVVSISSAVERPRNLLINATRATTGIIDSAASRGLEFKLRRFLEKFRRRMSQGIPELGIPVLEPLHLDELDIRIDNPEIGNISLVITDLDVRKLSTFLIEKAKLSLIGPTISVNVSVPEVYAEGQYNVSGKVGQMFVLRGAGPFRCTIFDLRLYVHTVLGYSQGMYLRTFDLDFNVGPVVLDVNDFMEDGNISKIMTKVAQELVPEAMDIVKPDILPGIQNYIAARANETIRHLTMRDIFHVLLGHTEIREFAPMLLP